MYRRSWHIGPFQPSNVLNSDITGITDYIMILLRFKLIRLSCRLLTGFLFHLFISNVLPACRSTINKAPAAVPSPRPYVCRYETIRVVLITLLCSCTRSPSRPGEFRIPLRLHLLFFSFLFFWAKCMCSKNMSSVWTLPPPPVLRQNRLLWCVTARRPDAPHSALAQFNICTTDTTSSSERGDPGVWRYPGLPPHYFRFCKSRRALPGSRQSPAPSQ